MMTRFQIEKVTEPLQQIIQKQHHSLIWRKRIGAEENCNVVSDLDKCRDLRLKDGRAKIF